MQLPIWVCGLGLSLDLKGDNAWHLTLAPRSTMSIILLSIFHLASKKEMVCLKIMAGQPSPFHVQPVLMVPRGLQKPEASSASGLHCVSAVWHVCTEYCTVDL